MAHTEISYQSHGSRVAKAVGGALLGICFFIVSFIVLFWNEGRAVQTEKSLTEGSKAVLAIKADRVDAANEGKLVALNGLATTEETLADPDFKISAKAIKLVREVEMYQWQEHRHEETVKRRDGSTYTLTTYTYDQDWSPHAVDSEAFSESYEHQNPKTMKYESSTLTAGKVTLGAFTLSPALVEKIDTSAPVTVEKKPAELKALKAVLSSGDLYLGKDPASPHVGDLKVHFKTVAPTNVSVVAQQAKSSFVPYQTSAGDALLLLKEGTLDAAQMFDAAQADNTAMTWVLRFLGWLMMLVGLGLVFRPVAVIGDSVPLLGTLAGAGLAVSAFLISSGLSLLTIGISWLFFRPLLGILLMAVAGGAGFLYVRRVMKKKALKAAEGGLAARLQAAA